VIVCAKISALYKKTSKKEVLFIPIHQPTFDGMNLDLFTLT